MKYESREYSSERDIDALRRNSMSGESGKRTGEKKVKMTLSAYKMRLKLLQRDLNISLLISLMKN